MPSFQSALASLTGKGLPLPQLSNHITLPGVILKSRLKLEAIAVGFVSRNTPKYLVGDVAADASRGELTMLAPTSRPIAVSPAAAPSAISRRRLMILPQCFRMETRACQLGRAHKTDQMRV